MSRPDRRERTATKGEISEQEYDKLIAQRETYRLRPKCKKNKAVSYICPARGASPTVSCPLVEGKLGRPS
ncbi:hypothetical protein ABMV07_06400 [Corynebacterium belfantii]|uniref:hypothetical protein n=1 Tax=Corynebacterium belfantii TaxID=2014537 RepID=UPI0035A93988